MTVIEAITAVLILITLCITGCVIKGKEERELKEVNKILRNLFNTANASYEAEFDEREIAEEKAKVLEAENLELAVALHNERYGMARIASHLDAMIDYYYDEKEENRSLREEIKTLKKS